MSLSVCAQLLVVPAARARLVVSAPWHRFARGPVHTAPLPEEAFASGLPVAMKGPPPLCGVAEGVHTRVPSRESVSSPLSVVAGMMAMRLVKPSLEGQLVDKALRSWVPLAATWLDVLVLRECGTLAHDKPPAWLAERHNFNGSALRGVHWRCFPRSNARQQLGQNYARLGMLLRSMHETLPQRDYYLKIDADTLVVPANLAHFLQHMPRRQLSYFGSTEVSSGSFDSEVRRRCAEFEACDALKGLSEPSEAGTQAPATTMHSGRSAPTRSQAARVVRYANRRHVVSYAQGGAEGLSYDALTRVVRADCIRRVGELPCSTSLCLHRAEDATLGVCMAALGVPLTRCACFFAWGPCNCNNATSCVNRLCRRPITIHKIKRLPWFDMWWGILTR